MAGGRIDYLAPEDPERKVRGRGQPGKSYRVHTGARTMMQGGHMKLDEVDPDANLRHHVRQVPDHPKGVAGELVRKYQYGTPAMAEQYGGFDRTRAAERAHYEGRVLGKPCQVTAAHSSYYYQLYRARALAPSSIFSEPLYDKRPQTAPGRGF